jgi:hypothetical protein
MSVEPCRHCGRDTSAGAQLFVGRVSLLGDPVEYVCPACLDEHPIRDQRGNVLSKARLAAMSHVLPPGEGLGG